MEGLVTALLLAIQAVHGSSANQECCAAKTVGDYSYTRVDTSVGFPAACPASCAYSRDDQPGSLYCFAKGFLPVECTEEGGQCNPGPPGPTEQPATFLKDSEHFNTFQTEAIKSSESVRSFFNLKMEKYGNAKNFSTIKEKLQWVKTDMESFAGQPLNNTSTRNYPNMKPSRMEKFVQMKAVLMCHLKKIVNASLHDNQEQVNQSIARMEEDLLHQSHDDHELQQAAHQGIQSVKLSLSLFKEDENGTSEMDKMISAIGSLNDTKDILADTKESSYSRKESIGKTCGEDITEGVAVGAVVGCLGAALPEVVFGVTLFGPGGVTLGTPTCLRGAIYGAIVGGAGGIVACAVHAIFHGCFAATGLVETPEGFKTISQLTIGDQIRTSSGGLNTQFTEFIGWLDRQQSAPVLMLQVFTSQENSPLTLTPSHIVFTANSTKYADELLPGDSLLFWNGTSMEEKEVSLITPTFEFGFWAPLTVDGTLLVNGYLTSCYASFPIQLAELALMPVKVFPKILLDNEESQHQDGVRKVVNLLKKIGDVLGARKEKGPSSGNASMVANNYLPLFMMKSEF